MAPMPSSSKVNAITPTDNEIAWIKVNDIKLASMKLARYVLLKKELDIYLFDIHELDFLKMILKDKKKSYYALK